MCVMCQIIFHTLDQCHSCVRVRVGRQSKAKSSREGLWEEGELKQGKCRGLVVLSVGGGTSVSDMTFGR